MKRVAPMRSNPVRSLILAGVAAALLAPASSAAITVIGGGNARECYLSVEHEAPVQATLAVCSLALEQERLTRHDRAATHVNRGIVHMRAGHFARALEDYEQSMRHDPTLVGAHVNLGAALYGLQRYDDALMELNTGLTKSEASADVMAVAYYNRALTHEKLGDITAAYDDFMTVLTYDPDFDLAKRQLERFEVISADEN